MSTTLVVALGVCTVLAAVRGTWSPCGLSMVSAINPFSERSRGNSYPATCAIFVLGAALGGTLLGALAAGAAAVVDPFVDDRPAASLLMALVLAAVALASEVRLGGFALPVHPRQVNEQWLGAYRRWVYAAGFGLQIGAGFATYIMTSATYLFVALAVLTGSPLLALGSGLAFGVVRGLAVTLSAGATDPGRLLALHRRLDRWTAPSVAVAVLVLAAVVVALAGGLAGPLGLAVAAAVVTVVLATSTGGRDAVRALAPPRAQAAPAAPAGATVPSRPAV